MKSSFRRVAVIGKYHAALTPAAAQQTREVLQDIARSSSYRQQITGPILVLPYVKTTHEWKTHAQTGERYQQERQQRGRLYFLPERFVLDVAGQPLHVTYADLEAAPAVLLVFDVVGASIARAASSPRQSSDLLAS